MNDRRHAAELEQEIEFLRSIPGEREFRARVADVFKESEPDDIAVEALRSAEVAPRTLLALETIIDSINDELRHNDRLPKDQQRSLKDVQRMRRRLNQFGAERSAIRLIVLQLEEAGRAPRRGGRPNPERRAEHRIGQLLRQPAAVVTHEDWVQVVAEEKAKDKADAKARKDARRLERSAGRLDERRARGTPPPISPNVTGYKVG